MTEEVGMMQEALVHDNVLVTGWRVSVAKNQIRSYLEGD